MKKYCVIMVTFMVILHLIQAQDQLGFISVDCGLSPRESPYNALATGLTYTSDVGLVNNGKIGRIAKEFKPFYSKPISTLRYFPNGIRSCYNLNVTLETNYLIRATFVYGNYDGLNVNPNFDIYLGPNLWTTVKSNDTIEEIIYVTKSNSLQVCLVKTGITTPFINVLELRPMNKDMYVPRSGSLKCLFRRYLSKSGPIVRYPKDIFDRQWHSFFMEKTWKEVTTTTHNNVNPSFYLLPPRVMATGATPLNTNAPLNITWTVEPPTAQFYDYVHQTELQTLRANDTREFNLVINGEIDVGPYGPQKLKTSTTYAQDPGQCDRGACLLQLVKTPQSTLPPLLNAIEVYTVIDFLQMETNGDDVVGIKNVQNTYGLSRINWQGDPCVPKQFLWDGLNCNNSDTSTPPVITSLNLSSSGLAGSITQAIQNLTHLQKLDLSNNNLTGEVPEFLADLKSLLIINLSGNNLSGSVPPSLIQKKGLELNVEGNSNLHCTIGACVYKEEDEHKKKSTVEGDGGQNKKSIVVPTVASIASIAILICVL